MTPAVVFFRFCQVKDEGEPVPPTHLEVFSIRYVHSGYTRMNEYGISYSRTLILPPTSVQLPRQVGFTAKI